MPSKLPIVVVGMALCHGAWAQTPQTPTAPLTLTFQEALERARVNSPQIISANIAALIAHEDTVQAKAALLPTANGFSQYIYTQPNGTPSGVFVGNDGPHIYANQLQVHGDIWSPAKIADYRKTQLAEAVARAKTEIAGRGLVATVVEDYYAMVSAARKLANARTTLAEIQRFADITQKQERGGEVAHSDTVLAQVQMVKSQRDLQEAQLALDKARLAFSVLLFPDFRQDFNVVDDLNGVRPLPAFDEIQGMAGRNSPDIRAAQATVEQQGFELKSARADRLPTLSFDYFYGMYANQFAIHDREGFNNLGNVAQAQLNIPLWNWGALKSRVKQAELRLQQARSDLSLTQRQLLANLHSFYLESQAASSQVASLEESLRLSTESLRLTLLRYQAGEVSVIEVKDAQNTLVDARNAYDDGMVRYRLALANLQTLTGAF
ncbi:MAG TPA: TolC family protein [Bryobacteraceae bacterium]